MKYINELTIGEILNRLNLVIHMNPTDRIFEGKSLEEIEAIQENAKLALEFVKNENERFLYEKSVKELVAKL